MGNRVREIIKLTNPNDWRHVPGIHNPADLPSRGCSPRDFVVTQWWEGPEWLKLSPEDWPSEEVKVDEEAVAKEKKKTATKLLNTEKDGYWYAPHSTFRKNVRFIGWMTRFVKFKSKREVKRGPLTCEELTKAETTILKLVQQDAFPCDEKNVAGIRIVKDEQGLLRVVTRLLNREDSEDFKMPVLLPSCHPIVSQLIMKEHWMNQHAGVQLLSGILRERFWILQTRRTIKGAIRKCIPCLRYKTKKFEVETAPLPENRVKTAKVFENIGVDLAGPLFLKDGGKAWIVLFTCAVYRCVHLELVTSLSTEAFLDAFSRHCARRGRPSVVYSDNGTNFVGANNALRALNWKKIEAAANLKQIKWIFNPPASPWWGGWWERLVRTVKELLRRTLGRTSLNYEKLSTLLCEIEGVINQRPLTAESDDPEDLQPLTPAMYLTEISSTETEFVDAAGFHKANKERKRLLELFKGRFRKEYLGLLIQKAKKLKETEVKVGDVVIVGQDNVKRLDWPLARILELLPGKDGKVRVAKVKTAMGILTRPLQRLYPMEVSSFSESVPSVFPIAPINEEAVEAKPVVITRVGRVIRDPRRFGFD